MRLLLFDIDGTLVRSRSGAGKRALDQAFERRYGWANATDGVSFAGVTDPLIVEQVFRKFGRSREEARAEQEAYFEDYLSLFALEVERADAPYQVLPGVRSLLEHLQPRDDNVLGVLTGNVEGGGRIKLRSCRLEAYFPIAAFGDEAPRRIDLLPLALARANALVSTPLTPEQVVVIGDSPRDVEVARAHGARAVAVATGFVSREALADTAPDVLLDDLSDREAVVTGLLG